MGTLKTIVVHKREPHDEYIGRPGPFGNPFGTREDSLAEVIVRSRTEAIASFQDWLLGVRHQGLLPERRLWIIQNLHRLAGKRLGCWCKPKRPCHGDVLAELVERLGLDPEEVAD